MSGEFEGVSQAEMDLIENHEERVRSIVPPRERETEERQETVTEVAMFACDVPVTDRELAVAWRAITWLKEKS